MAPHTRKFHPSTLFDATLMTHSQFGNMLVLSATWRTHYLRTLIDQDRFQVLLGRTIGFLRKLSAISPTCQVDCSILEKIQRTLFGDTPTSVLNTAVHEMMVILADQDECSNACRITMEASIRNGVERPTSLCTTWCLVPGWPVGSLFVTAPKLHRQHPSHPNWQFRHRRPRNADLSS